MPTVVGLFLFTQFWYWFPMAHTLSLAFTPTTIICVTPDLKVPQTDYVSNAKPSVFAYPPATEAPKVDAKEKVCGSIQSMIYPINNNYQVTTATLSFAARLKAKKKDEEKKAEEKKAEAVKMDVDKPAEVKAKEPEPDVAQLANPSRVLQGQLKKITFESGSRYQPVLKVHVRHTPR